MRPERISRTTEETTTARIVPGFYKNDGGVLICAENFVSGPGFDLVKEEKDTYAYPVDGWTWFDSEAQAKTAFGL